MTNNNKFDVTRRSLLRNSAKGAIGLGVVSSLGLQAIAMPVDAITYWTKERTERYLCGQIHSAKSAELTRVLHSPYLDKADKNLALKSTHCPKCNVHIHPAQVIDPYVVSA